MFREQCYLELLSFDSIVLQRRVVSATLYAYIVRIDGWIVHLTYSTSDALSVISDIVLDTYSV